MSAAAGARTTVHLVRHAEVDNPQDVLYGRLPGFGLTARGEQQALQVAAHLAGRDVRLVAVSPMERARRTAAPVLDRLGVEEVVDERLVEASSAFEGLPVSMHRSVLRQPRIWPRLWNPWRPSWGEPYRVVAARMWSVVDEARDAARGGEAVLVSHQMPIWVTRRRAEGRRLAHHPRRRQCAPGSVTSLHFEGDRLASVGYWEPLPAPEERQEAP